MSDFPSHPLVLELAAGRPIIDPLRRSARASRLIVDPDGSTEAVLVALARRLYPEVDLSRNIVFWKDKNWQNETPENVTLTPAAATRAKSPYQALSGTPEYHRAYRQANKAKFREYTARYNTKLKVARIAVISANMHALPSDSFAARLQERLEAIIASPSPSTPLLEQLADARQELETGQISPPDIS